MSRQVIHDTRLAHSRVSGECQLKDICVSAPNNFDALRVCHDYGAPAGYCHLSFIADQKRSPTLPGALSFVQG